MGPDRRRENIGPVERLVSRWYGALYDWIVRRFPPYRALLAEVVECARTSLATTSAPRVLELHCGSGAFSAALAEQGWDVVGEDAYPALIERASRRTPEKGQLTFRVGPGADGGYDLVVSVHALYAQADPARDLSAMCGRLRRGGHAIVVNFSRPAPIASTMRAAWVGDGPLAALRALVWLVPNAIFDWTRAGRPSHYWTKAELTAQLAIAGFEVLQVRPTFLAGISLLARCRKPVAG
jgi:SAM-dependent methyltransferase